MGNFILLFLVIWLLFFEIYLTISFALLLPQLIYCYKILITQTQNNKFPSICIAASYLNSVVCWAACHKMLFFVHPYFIVHQIPARQSSFVLLGVPGHFPPECIKNALSVGVWVCFASALPASATESCCGGLIRFNNISVFLFTSLSVLIFPYLTPITFIDFPVSKTVFVSFTFKVHYI